jgi:hypothetical protein
MLQNNCYHYIECQKLQRKIEKMYQLTHDAHHHLSLKGEAKGVLVEQRQNHKIRVHWQEMK